MTGYAKQQILRMETYAKFPYLIEITHNLDDGTSNIYRYANCDEDVTYNGNVYSAGFFQVSPPEKKRDGFSDAKLTISAVDKEWIKKIRTTQKRATVRFIATIQYEKNSIESIEPIEEMEFILTNATWNQTAIQWTMIFDDLMDLNVPCEEITDRICPALV